ncbi:MAG TPA: NADP-dependent malic enzyme [Cytophagales bacterium]|nr:NADP-dependent malic enzyme [Cytophagales bacterium]
MSKIRREEALNYHEFDKPGKIEVVPTKPVASQSDLALAYSPGVAEPCKDIAENKEDVYKYTAKGNLVGVISNGTAVLGLGNIGPEASKPVMEGKGVLFKKFAGLDCFDIEINCEDPEQFVNIVASLEPTFGGINLEDIKAPECFYIEQELRKRMNIPLMHDDQHGTAIISSAALLNSLKLTGKKIEEIKVVFSGAGAAALACARLYLALGLKADNLIMSDIEGVIRKDRPNLNATHADIATEKDIHTLTEALIGADVFVGLSVANVLKPEMLLTMAADPIVFALANPNPEIEYELAIATRTDIIMATGRSDHPNQVNNVLGFPYIFRGAMDVRATEINEAMKLAAVIALADLAKTPVPEIVNKAYGDDKIVFGRNYLIPKPLDPRLITEISIAVAEAAVASGVAKKPITDWIKYEMELQNRIGLDQKLISTLMNNAKKSPKKVVFPEAHEVKILKAAQYVVDEKIAEPILLGNEDKIRALALEFNVDIAGCHIIDHRQQKELLQKYGEIIYQKRRRKGVTPAEGRELMKNGDYFGAMMVEVGEADALITGLTQDYPKALLPALHTIGAEEGISKVAGMYIVNSKKGIFFFADTTVNINPTVDELVDIIGLAARAVQNLEIEPRIAVLSYSNFGSSKGDIPMKTSLAAKKANEKYPGLIIDGDIQADVALNTTLQRQNYPFSELAEKGANTFIFPDLASGNISYKLVHNIGDTEVIGPMLLGMKKPVHVLQLGCSVREIVNMVAIAVMDAQLYDRKHSLVMENRELIL